MNFINEQDFNKARIALANRERAEHYMHSAETNRALKDYTEALTEAYNGLELEPENQGLLCELMRIYSICKMIDELRKVFLFLYSFVAELTFDTAKTLVKTLGEADASEFKVELNQLKERWKEAHSNEDENAVLSFIIDRVTMPDVMPDDTVLLNAVEKGGAEYSCAELAEFELDRGNYKASRCFALTGLACCKNLSPSHFHALLLRADVALFWLDVRDGKADHETAMRIINQLDKFTSNTHRWLYDDDDKSFEAQKKLIAEYLLNSSSDDFDFENL